MQILHAASIGEQITIGKLHFYHRQSYELTRASALTWEEEDARFLWAQGTCVRELDELYDRAGSLMNEEEASIFAIHALLLKDEDLTRRVRAMIREEGVTAEFAIQTVGDQVMETFAGMESTYMQARAADIQDITRRMVLRLLNIRPDYTLDRQPTILVSDSFLPSEVMELDRRRILGLVTTKGSLESHSSLLLRWFRIPAMVGVPLDESWEGCTALIDGHAGRLYLEPTVELTEQLRLAYERDGCPVSAPV